MTHFILCMFLHWPGMQSKFYITWAGHIMPYASFCSIIKSVFHLNATWAVVFHRVNIPWYMFGSGITVYFMSFFIIFSFALPCRIHAVNDACRRRTKTNENRIMNNAEQNDERREYNEQKERLKHKTNINYYLSYNAIVQSIFSYAI